ncbi:MAG: hypothetical protein RLN69_07555 [Woeseiaceae bacterium]
MKTSVTLLSALLAVFLTHEVLACGDSLYRVGTGISYREYTAPLPGNVLIYGETEGANELAEALTRSGHTVRQVGNEQALEAELQTNSYDVIIAAYREHDAVDKQSEKTDATFLPVAQDQDEKIVAMDRYGDALVVDQDELKHYLKAIHKALKNKSVQA